VRAPRRTYSSVCARASAVLVLLACATIAIDVICGHALLAALYESHSPLTGIVMRGHTTEPLAHYREVLDAVVLKTSGALVVAAVILLLARNVIGTVLSIGTALVMLVGIFVLIDAYPPLATALHVDSLPYFRFRITNLPDRSLAFVERPLSHSTTPNYRGGFYSPTYGIDVEPTTVVWDTDADGFRNRVALEHADIIILGSSFPGFGARLEDTYARKLEHYSGGATVSNLSKGGYGPAEFLTVFRRYGLPKTPRVAILAFHTGDIDNATAAAAQSVARRIFFGTFFERWSLVLEELWHAARASVGSALATGLKQLTAPEPIHPDVAVIRLPNGAVGKAVFFAKHTGQPTDALLRSRSWRSFHDVVLAFKAECEQHHITPVLVYIPWATEIYSEYTGADSGRRWRAIRQSEVSTSGNDEAAARTLSEAAGIPLISLLPAFREAARDGKFLYHPLDDHWNAEGSDVAAATTARALRQPYVQTGTPEHPASPVTLSPVSATNASF